MNGPKKRSPSSVSGGGFLASDNWVPLDVVLNAIQTGTMRVYVDVQQWAGIHVGPDEKAEFNPTVRIMG